MWRSPMKPETQKKLVKFGTGLVGMLLFGMGVSLFNAEADHQGAHQLEVAKVKDSGMKRMELKLPPAAQEGLKLTMREHLEAIDAIVLALVHEEFSKAAILATEELGFSKHHVAMQREAGATFPAAYRDLALEHHRAAEVLGTVIPTKDLKHILPHLQQTIHACVVCHQAFRL